jgi:cyclohexa-1,5-dienecarbonyl-CoA hydratase
LNRVFPADTFDQDTETFIQSITQNSGAILRFNKKAVNETQQLPFDKALARASDIFLNELMKSDDTMEGINAFFEKRKPEWTDS